VNRNLVYFLVGLMLMTMMTCLAGCREPDLEVDSEDLSLIDQYIEELSLALLDVEPDLLGWVREPYSDNYPLKYSEERIILLTEHLKIIQQIRKQRQKDTFPDEDIIAKWRVVVIRGSNEWFLEGPAVVDALTRLAMLSDRVEQAIALIIDNEGKLDADQSQLVVTLIEELAPEIEAIRVIFYK